MNGITNPLNGILGLLQEIQTCDKADATSATIIMVYVGIDVMGRLSMPDTRTSATRRDFIAWVDKYLKAETDSTYQYDGKEVYAARCAMVHSYSTEADLHKNDAHTKQFGYHDGGQHKYDPNVSKELVVIGVKSLVHDFSRAVEAFVKDMCADKVLRDRVATRIPKIVQTFPLH